MRQPRTADREIFGELTFKQRLWWFPPRSHLSCAGESWTSITGNLAIDLTQINQHLSTQQYFRAIGYWFGLSASEAQLAYPRKPSSTLTVFNRLVASKTQAGVRLCPFKSILSLSLKALFPVHFESFLVHI